MPSICLVYTCRIPVLSSTRYNSWENNHHECRDSLCVLKAWLDAIHPLERITTWVLLENKFVSYTWYMTYIWTEMSYDSHMIDIWQVKTFYRFQMWGSSGPSVPVRVTRRSPRARRPAVGPGTRSLSSLTVSRSQWLPLRPEQQSLPRLPPRPLRRRRAIMMTSPFWSPNCLLTQL